MESVKCAVCGAVNAEILFEGRDLWHGIEGRFPVRRCLDCGLIYLSPRPERAEIGRYYPDDYAPYHLADSETPNWWRRWNQHYAQNKRARAIEARVAGRGKALDVGCASGGFLEALRRRGWEVAGVESNAVVAEHARASLGLDVFAGELEEAGFPENAFDLVTMWHVLEHVHDPLATLDEIARIIRPGGTLLLAIPDPDSLEARLFGRFWAGWDVPRHLHIFSRPLISRILCERGWQVSDVIYMTGRHWLFHLSLRHWAQAKISNPLVRRLLLAAAGSLPARLLTLPVFILLERLQKGSIMVLFAVRERKGAE